MRRPALAPLLLGALLCLLAGRAAADEPQALRRVVIGTYVNQISNIDIKNGQFVIDFYVWFRWKGDDFKPLDSFELMNGRVTSKGSIVKKKIGDENYVTCRVLATITKFFDLRRYPLDSHSLTIELEDAEADMRQMRFEVDVDNTGYSPELQVPGWVIAKSGPKVDAHVYHTNYGDTSMPKNQESAYSRYTFSLEVARPGYGRFMKVFFGLFIAVLISWCSFYVRPKESSPRVSLGVGATFAAAAVTVTINNSLPDTNAITLADKLMMLTLGAIVVTVAETIIALTLFAKEKVAMQQKLDRICGIVIPAIYVVILLAVVF